MARRKFTAEDMEAPERTEYMPFGINVVKLTGAFGDETDDGKEFIEIGVVNEAGIEDKARLWFNGKAAKYSVDTIRQIAVHKMKTEADKDRARKAVDACTDIDDLANLITGKLQNAEAWLTKYYDPERTYTTQNGETRRSINTNLLGYEPKLKPELMPAPNTGPANVDAMLNTEKPADDPFFDNMGDPADGAVDATIDDTGTVDIPDAGAWGK